jgi:hypothetical protein
MTSDITTKYKVNQYMMFLHHQHMMFMFQTLYFVVMSVMMIVEPEDVTVVANVRMCRSFKLMPVFITAVPMHTNYRAVREGRGG